MRSIPTSTRRPWRAALVVVALVAAPWGLAAPHPAAAVATPSADATGQRTLAENSMNRPNGLAVDGDGNIWIADSYNNRVLERRADGTQVGVLTVTNPSDIAVDPEGNVYVVETNGGRIIEIPKAGGAPFDLPLTGLNTSYGVYGVDVDAAGTVYVADTGNNRVVKLPKGGPQSTVFGMYLPFGVGVDGAGNVYASQAYGGELAEYSNGTLTYLGSYLSPWGLDIDAAGNAYLASFRDGLITKRATDGTVTTLMSGLFEPKDVTVDAAGNVWASDFQNRVLEIPVGGTVQEVPFTGLNNPTGIAVGADGAIYVADDRMNGRVVKIVGSAAPVDVGFPDSLDSPGDVEIDASGAVYVTSWYGNQIWKKPPSGPAQVLGITGLRQPAGVAVDAAGTVYVTDWSNTRVVKYTTGGVQSTVPITGLSSPSGIGVDTAGNLYVTDNLRVIKYTPGGVQSNLPIAGLAGAGNMAVSPAGDVYVVDYPNNRILALPAGGTQYTVGFTDIFNPWGVGIDAGGNVYVTPRPPSPGLVVLSPVSGPPDAPGTASATSGDASAKVSWTAPVPNGTPPVDSYTVTPVTGGVPLPSQTFPASTTTGTVTGLTNGVTYTFEVAATNVDGTGPAVTTAPVTIGLPDAPIWPHANRGSTTATVSWLPGADHGVPLTGYVITPRLDGVAQAPQLFDASTTVRIVTGLVPGGSYTFRVAAVNAAGTGPASETAPIAVGSPAAPIFAFAQRGDGSATVVWLPGDDHGAPITGYEITPTVDGVAQAPQVFASAATIETVTGLTNGTSYTFRVRALNAYGIGGVGTTAPITVGTPGAPYFAWAHPLDAWSTPDTVWARVTWVPPADNGAFVSGYVVTPIVDGVELAPRHVSFTSVVMALPGGTTYRFEVQAVNARGPGGTRLTAPFTRS